ncbi:MAG: CapA family protein, partial [Fibrobacter sp.]|nr:CapA family protein [Fibrobacter sp.]
MAKMSKKRVSITFTGDIGFDKFMTGKWTDENLLAKPVLDFLQGSDHVVANIEGAMTDMVDDGTHGQFFHSMDPAARCVLER